MADSNLSFANHIRPMFRQLDVDSMDGIIDLTSKDEVQANADAIIERINRGADDAGVMPPKD
ncbi:unnamed protein product, partial [marine sediment metagenome]